MIGVQEIVILRHVALSNKLCSQQFLYGFDNRIFPNSSAEPTTRLQSALFAGFVRKGRRLKTLTNGRAR